MGGKKMGQAIQQEKQEARINRWKPKNDSQIYVYQDNKLFVCKFDKIFNQPKFSKLNRFQLKKGSYENQLDVITKYINYFINFYDTDNELVTGYLKLKKSIDKDGLFTVDNTEAFIDAIYEFIFTDTMVEKIKKLVDDNYHDDVEGGDSDKKKKYKNNKKHLESLEFTNEHVKILLRISMGIKIMSPIVFHYYSMNLIKIVKDSDMIYNFYQRLFPLFEDGCNMYNKLFLYVRTKILESNANNQKIFEPREIFGVDLFTVINSFTKRVLIAENVVKYKFDGNILGMNRTITKFQIQYFLKDQYEKTLAEVTMQKNSDGLSAIDKMNMNLTKIDEGVVVLSEINISLTIDYLKRLFDVGVTNEQIEYYVKYHKPSEIQVFLVNSFFAKYFGSYRDLNLLNRRFYITLLCILKKKLLLDLGYDEEGVLHSAALPYILSGNMVDRLNNRVIRNMQFKSNIENTYLYEKLKTEKHQNMQYVLQKQKSKNNGKATTDIETALASSLTNTKFTFVEYDHPELLGKEMNFSENKISCEVLYYLYDILQ